MSDVTIVIIVKDNSEGLIRTVSSVLSQSSENWNAVIVAGASTDRTLEVANAFQAEYPQIRLLVQEGLGIYEAMNQGTLEVDTEFVWYMNAGDVFASKSALEVGLESALRSKAAVIIGHHKVDGSERKYTKRVGEIRPIVFAFSRSGGCHQSIIFSTQYLNLQNTYNCNYRLAADFDLVLRLISKYGGYRIAEVLSIIEPNGVSARNLRKVHEERQLIRNIYFRNNPIFRILGRAWIWALFIKIKLR
jgi:glycosyltransferase involved in cell wall biosynthesis